MEFRSLQALTVLLVLATTAAVATTPDITATPRNTFPVETVSLSPSANNATSPSTPIPAARSTLDKAPVVTMPGNGGLYQFSGTIICSGMNQKSWDKIIYACERNEYSFGKALVFIRHDGSYLLECGCRDGLESYFATWGFGWGKLSSGVDLATCYVRLLSTNSGLWWVSLQSRIRQIKCRDNLKCDTEPTGKCVFA